MCMSFKPKLYNNDLGSAYWKSRAILFYIERSNREGTNTDDITV